MSAKVLIVDDDASIRQLIRVALKQFAISADEAEDGAVALKMIGERRRGERYGVIILDLMMPNLSGAGVLAALSVSDLPACILIISAAADAELAQHLSSPQVIATFRKPFDIVDLITAVRDCLAGSVAPATT